MNIPEPLASKQARKIVEKVAANRMKTVKEKLKNSKWGKYTKMELIERLEKASVSAETTSLYETSNSKPKKQGVPLLPDSYEEEQKEAREQFLFSRAHLHKKLVDGNYPPEEVLKFFYELRQEYHKVCTDHMITVIVDVKNDKPQRKSQKATQIQIFGAQIWSAFIEQALASHATDSLDLVTYLAHAINVDKYTANKSSEGIKSIEDKNSMIGVTQHQEKLLSSPVVAPAPAPVHSEALQDMQAFLDESKVTKKATKLDLMCKYEAALDIIQAQAQRLLELEEAHAPLMENLREQLASGNLDNVAEYIESMKTTIEMITRDKRIQREIMEEHIDEQAADLSLLKEGTNKIVEAQEILRMGLLLSISDEFDDAARQFLNEAGEKEAYDAQDDML